MTSLAMTAASAPLVDTAARTISGLAVPFGPVGATSGGQLRFAAGALSWSNPRRVKLLREHDQRDAVGYARELVELTAAEVDARMTAAGAEPLGLPGLWATFHVPEGPAGDAALAEAANGLRDALSVGVQLDAATFDRLRRAARAGGAVEGSGQLRETSLVSVPAFDDARVGAVAAHADLTVSSWSRASADSTTDQPDTDTPGETVPEQPTEPTPTPVVPTPQPTAPEQPTVPAQPVTTAAAAPLAVAGAALVTSEPSTYTFAADGPSLVSDAWAARMRGDGEAAERLHRFNAELLGGNTASGMALAAVLTSTDVETQAADGGFFGTTRLPIREAIDRGRPLLSRVSTVPIRNAQPFLLPIEGEFDGVADHTEGTAHVPEGTLTLGDATMSPKATSGAYRISREVVDSSNPAIDRIALRAMLRDYRRKTEGKFLTALTTAAGVGTAVAGPVALDLALLQFGPDGSDDEPTWVAASKTALANLASYLDGDGRQLLPAVGPSNAPGTRRAGTTGYSIGGAELVKAASITGTDVLAVDEQGVLVAESAVQTFRFDEVEGPGVVKLALFAYFGAAVLESAAVERFTVAAYTPPV